MGIELVTKGNAGDFCGFCAMLTGRENEPLLNEAFKASKGDAVP